MYGVVCDGTLESDLSENWEHAGGGFPWGRFYLRVFRECLLRRKQIESAILMNELGD